MPRHAILALDATADVFLYAVCTVPNAVMSVSSHLAVQRNAFSTAQAAAKVCDGICSASIAERLSNVQIVNSPKGQSAFLLMPSITGHAWTHAAKDDPADAAHA